MKKWFALYSRPRAEKRVAERLREAGFLVYLPVLKVMRRWSDRVKVVEMPLFSSYVFVNCVEEDLWSAIKLEGVVKAIFFNGKPASIKDNEIEAIKNFTLQAGNCELIEGDNVDIICGALVANDKPVSGKIIKIKKDYLYLWVEQLGAKVCVKKEAVRKELQKRKTHSKE